MASVWLPGALRIPGPHSAGLPMAGGNCLLTHHITVSPKNSYAATRDYLIHEGFEPTLILDPWFGHRGQFLPGDRGGYALQHPNGQPETNREGRIHIQVEWLSPDMHTDLATGGYFTEQWHDLCLWSRALGVPYEWPFGHPLATSRNPKTWRLGGHRGHINAPGNSHVDSLVSTRMAWPTPPPQPHPSEEDTMRLYRVDGTDPVWATDYVQRRWVQTSAELAQITKDTGLHPIVLPKGSTFLNDIPIVGAKP